VKHIPLRERIDSAFDQGDDEYSRQYLSILIENWREVARAFRRTTMLIAALIIGFVLLEGSKTAQVTIGPLKLENIWTVLTVVPVLIAILNYECVSLFAAFAMYRETTSELVRVIRPSVHDNDLERMLAPPTLSLIGAVGGTWEDVHQSAPSFARTILTKTSVTMLLVLIVGSIGFLGYTYFQLYTSRHVSPIAVSVSLVLAVLYSIRAVALMVHTEDQY
jgi:hypothetical protein